MGLKSKSRVASAVSSAVAVFLVVFSAEGGFISCLCIRASVCHLLSSLSSCADEDGTFLKFFFVVDLFVLVLPAARTRSGKQTDGMLNKLWTVAGGWCFEKQPEIVHVTHNILLPK